jgi:uncharacterized GH25 family protein
MKRRTRAALLPLALVCLAAVSAAHETWILPTSMRVRVGQPVVLGVTSGLKFPNEETVVAPARIDRSEVRLGNEIDPLPRPQITTRALHYLWTPKVQGIATITVEVAPRSLELKQSEIKEYFAEIHASPAIIAQWDSVPKPRRWRESYTKHAVSYVRVGPASPDSSWKTPMGLTLEIVPESNPAAITAGGRLPVRVLFNGAPLAGFSLGARLEGRARSAFVTTDGSGRASVPLLVKGRWLLFGTHLRRTNEPNLEWRSDFVTMTTYVAPAGTR